MYVFHKTFLNGFSYRDILSKAPLPSDYINIPGRFPLFFYHFVGFLVRIMYVAVESVAQNASSRFDRSFCLLF